MAFSTAAKHGVSVTTTPGPVLQRRCDCGASAKTGEKCPQCDGDEKRGVLQREATGYREGGKVPPIVHEVLRTPGRPLDATTRAFMEPRFGHDFSQVRLHTDSIAGASASAVNAAAYTVGSHIVFGAHNDTGSHGIPLMAHELTHVIQQRHQRHDSRGDLEIAPASDAFESEAHANEQRIMGGLGGALGSQAPAPVQPRLQRSLLDILKKPFRAIASVVKSIGRVFGAENYSDDELLAYYNEFVAKGRIEGAYDSDNKARALINRWTGRHLILTTEEGRSVTLTLQMSHKIALGQELFTGHRSGADVARMLDLLRSCKDSEIPLFVRGVGKELLESKEDTGNFLAEWQMRQERQARRQAAQAEAEKLTGEATPEAPRVPRAAEQISYSVDRSFTNYGLSDDNIKEAVSLFGTTDVANEVVKWLQDQSVQFMAIFVARGKDMPSGGEAGASGYHQRIGPGKWRIWVVAGMEFMDVDRLGQVAKGVKGSRDAQGIADTLFHELLHVWFKTRYPDQGTGHTAAVGQPKKTAFGNKQYDEPNYDEPFLTKLKEFDAQSLKQQSLQR